MNIRGKIISTNYAYKSIMTIIIPLRGIMSITCSMLRVPAQVFLIESHVVVKRVVYEEEGGGRGDTYGGVRFVALRILAVVCISGIVTVAAYLISQL